MRALDPARHIMRLFVAVLWHQQNEGSHAYFDTSIGVAEPDVWLSS
jgi:hypothetical protein